MNNNKRHDLQPLRGNSPRRSKCYLGRPLIDLAELQSKVLGHLLTSDAQTLSTAAMPVGAVGVYALQYRGDDNPLLARFASHGSVVYVGKGILRERWKAHAESLDEAQGLSADDFSIRVIPYGSFAESSLAEALLIDALLPVFNEPTFSGLGSRLQGERRRQHQTASPFDVMFPGRVGRAQPTPADDARLERLTAAFKAFPAIPMPDVEIDDPYAI